VEFRRGGEALFARAQRETVLAAGAIGSPQLLQLSGIGPAALLERLQIPVVHHLPGVGERRVPQEEAKGEGRGFHERLMTFSCGVWQCGHLVAPFVIKPKQAGHTWVDKDWSHPPSSPRMLKMSTMTRKSTNAPINLS